MALDRNLRRSNAFSGDRHGGGEKARHFLVVSPVLRRAAVGGLLVASASDSFVRRVGTVKQVPDLHGTISTSGRSTMAKKAFKCPRCGRSFLMKAHLARHLSAGHGVRSKRKAKTVRAGGRKKAKRRRVTRMGRPKGVVSRFGLRTLSLEQLGEVIVAARAEARSRVTKLQKALK